MSVKDGNKPIPQHKKNKNTRTLKFDQAETKQILIQIQLAFCCLLTKISNRPSSHSQRRRHCQRHQRFFFFIHHLFCVLWFFLFYFFFVSLFLGNFLCLVVRICRISRNHFLISKQMENCLEDGGGGSGGGVCLVSG